MNEIPDWAVETTQSILSTVYAKDPFTFHHCCRVGRASRLLAKAVGLSEFEQSILEYSGLFHDVGKVGIPDNILLKPGRLNSDEFDIMKSHVSLSVKIVEPLSGHPFFKFVLPGVRYHHERWDGNGYTAGLAGEDIPLAARIIAVVDTVDAMSNTRPYRKGVPMDLILEELARCSGSQFDEKIVQIYLESSVTWDKDLAHENTEVIIPQVLTPAA